MLSAPVKLARRFFAKFSDDCSWLILLLHILIRTSIPLRAKSLIERSTGLTDGKQSLLHIQSCESAIPRLGRGNAGTIECLYQNILTEIMILGTLASRNQGFEVNIWHSDGTSLCSTIFFVLKTRDPSGVSHMIKWTLHASVRYCEFSMPRFDKVFAGGSTR